MRSDGAFTLQVIRRSVLTSVLSVPSVHSVVPIAGFRLKVYAELCQAVEEHLAILHADGRDAPPGDAHDYCGKLTLRIKPALHRALALRASAAGDSLTGHIERELTRSLAPA